MVGVIFEMYFTYLQVFVIEAVCIWCAAYGISLLARFLLSLIVWLRRDEFTTPAGDAVDGAVAATGTGGARTNRGRTNAGPHRYGVGEPGAIRCAARGGHQAVQVRRHLGPIEERVEPLAVDDHGRCRSDTQRVALTGLLLDRREVLRVVHGGQERLAIEADRDRDIGQALTRERALVLAVLVREQHVVIRPEVAALVAGDPCRDRGVDGLLAQEREVAERQPSVAGLHVQRDDE